MNNIHKKYQKLVFAFLTVLMLSMQLVSFGQSGSFGNTFVFGGAEMGIISVQHNFQNGGSGVLAGIVGTERTSAQGYLSFSGAASWAGAADNAHVDGYVKTYMTTAFTFPIGDNATYRPAAVSTASFASPADAAYFGVNASTAITSSLKGGNEPILPTGGVFNTSSKDATISVVDNVEYWDINGSSAAKITLTWNGNSGVSALTGGDLSLLTIVGWDGTKWVKIPSTSDATSLLGGASTASAGSITTTASLVPNTYNVYTLGSITSFTVTQSTLSSSPSSSVVSGNAASQLAPAGGTPGYSYSNGSLDPSCVAPVGTTALPVSSNLLVNTNGSYSYTTPTNVGTYYFCIKVCDSTLPTAVCRIATYKVTATCATGSSIPVLKIN
jgi:hypothetical protein